MKRNIHPGLIFVGAAALTLTVAITLSTQVVAGPDGSPHQRPDRQLLPMPVALAVAPSPPGTGAQNQILQSGVVSKTIEFVAPKNIEVTPGKPFYFDFCHNSSTPPPDKGLIKQVTGKIQPRLSARKTPCGESGNPSGDTIKGGNPPYHFQTEGGFPPMGLHLDPFTGILSGKMEKPAPGGPNKFTLCAIDMSGNPSCKEITPQVDPASSASKSGSHGSPSHTGLIVGLAGAAAGVGVAAAELGAKNGTKNCTSLEQECSNLSSECLGGNSSACQQVNSACTQSCQCAGYSGFNVGTGSCQ